MKKNVVIYGVGEFASLMKYYLSMESDTRFNVVGFTVDDAYIVGNEFCGLPVHGFSEAIKFFSPETHKLLIAVGYSNMRARKKVYEMVKVKGYKLINYIHPSVDIKNLVLDDNNIILSNVTIEPFVTIGSNNVIWSDTLLGHDLVIQSHNYISAKCLLAGKCKIGNTCFIGNGVIMINSLIIEDETYLVAGTNIRKSTRKFGMYSGNPSKLLKLHEKNGIIIS